MVKAVPMKAFDEMVEGGLYRGAQELGDPERLRTHYGKFAAWLGRQPEQTIAARREEAELLFRRVGITFAVYGDSDGTERTIPFDLIPRIFPANEWTRLERGLRQRVQALNMFLHGAERRLLDLPEGPVNKIAALLHCTSSR